MNHEDRLRAGGAQDVSHGGACAGVQAGALQVRRSQGGWTFSPASGTLGAGALVSLALGDADGDGDPDVAATCSAGGDATVTYVLVNKVR